MNKAGSISVKVCGITEAKDARFALELGADKLGFITYEKSPRKIDFEKIENIKSELSLDGKKMVAVEVEPTIEHLKKIMDQGFGVFQLHFSYDLSRDLIGQWSQLVGAENLWLAPRLPMGVSFPEDLFSYSKTFLIDAYSESKFGGTGERSDWESFSALQHSFSTKKWVLAGGLSQDNIRLAIKSTNAEIVDVNSGVERSPGVKDHGKLKKLFSEIS